MPVQLAGLGLAYWLAVVLAVELVSPVDNIALFWPANAMAAVALILVAKRHWPLFLGAMVLAFFVGRVPSGHFPFYVYAGLCLANVIEVLVVAELTRRVVGIGVRRDNLALTLSTALWASIAAAVASALIGSAFVVSAIPEAMYFKTAVGWFTSDLSGLALVLPVLLTWLTLGPPKSLKSVELMESAGIVIALAALCSLVVIYLSDVRHIMLLFPYLAFPVLIWTALRSGPRGTALAILAVGMLIISLTYFGYGLFDFHGLSDFAQVNLMKVGLTTIALTAVILNIIVVGRKRAERALRESQSDYQNLLNGSIQGVLIASIERKPLFANAECAAIFGYLSPEELLNLESTLPLIAPGEVKRLNQFRAPYEIGDPDETVAYEFEGVRKDGGRIWLDLRGRAVDWRGQKASHLTLIDITERKRAEEKLRMALIDSEHASRAKSNFLASMSHELRTPLNAIIGFADMIENQYFGPLGSAKYGEYAHDIQDSSRHLLALVNDILDLSAIEAGKHVLAKESLVVEKVVADCRSIISRELHDKNITWSLELANDIMPLFADERALKQILYNLLANAAKFTGEDGKIRLGVTASNGFHTFEIEDTGCGIPADKLSTITDPFVRTESNPHLAQEGAGLGLAIVGALVDLHKGALGIRSEVGSGTTVSVILPSEDR